MHRISCRFSCLIIGFQLLGIVSFVSPWCIDNKHIVFKYNVTAMVTVIGCEGSVRYCLGMKPRKHRLKSLIFVFFLLFLIWVLLQFLAPLVLPTGSVADLSGVVGFSDNEDVLRNMSFPWDVVYSSGDRLCHQIADRSLFLNGNEMPYCTRCTGIWIGIMLGLGLMVFYTMELQEKFVLAILLGLVPIGIDGVGQLFGLWTSINPVRFITGLLAGSVCGVAIGAIIDEIKILKKSSILKRS